MSRIDASTPRAQETGELFNDPLGFLARARASLGDVFVIREDKALFSRAPDCAGVVAVFGAANHQAVLTDAELFRQPVSAAQDISLPQNLVNLNQGLHSMQGAQHDQHQRLLMNLLSERSNEGRQQLVHAGLEKFVQGWQYDRQISLLEEMRRLTLELSTRLLFGEQYDDSPQLASLAEQYFHARRAVASTFKAPNKGTRAKLIALGTSLDEGLRRYIDWSLQETGGDGLLRTLTSLETFSDDELVAHSNVLFMSSLEPTAVTLTWTFLILSQLPDLRRDLREDQSQLDGVINETLRLFTPNALMTRLTTRAMTLSSFPIPQNCEILLSPFLAHREPERFPHPDEFLPERWQRTKPSPFVYFPFCGGAHYCAGRSLATYMIKTSLAFLLRRYDLILSYDQAVDWKIEIVLLPENDPLMSLRKPDATLVSGGKLIGPVRELIDLKS